MMSHYLGVQCETDGVQQRAVCGLYIFPQEHSDQPSCPRCADFLQAEYETLEEVHARELAEQDEPIPRRWS